MFIVESIYYIKLMRHINTFVIWCLQYRFTILTLPSLLYDIKVGLVIVFLAFLLDLLTVTGTFLLTFDKGNKSIERDKSLFESDSLEEFSDSLTQDIENYFKGANATYNYRNRLADREFMFVKCPDLIGSCLSYPFIAGPTIILVPSTFDSTFPRDKALLAHEFMHCIAHDLNVTLHTNMRLFCYLFLVISIIISCLYSIIWPTILGIVYLSYTLFLTHFSLLGNMEQEANLIGLRYVEDRFGTKEMQEAATTMIKMRQIQFLDKVQHLGPTYISEYNQIHFLSYFVSSEEKQVLAQRLKKKAKKNIENESESMKKRKFTHTKILNLAKIYDSPYIYESTHGVNMYAFSSGYIFFTIIIVPFALYFSTLLYNWIFPALTLNAFLVIGILLIFIFILIKIINKRLWNKRAFLTRKIGVQ